MANRSGIPRDVNKLAKAIVEEATDEAASDKNPAAVALGRLGGLKGGPARMKALTKKQRSELGRRAALARWGNRKGAKPTPER